MLVAAWNVNSIRARVDHVRQWLQANQPDALLLQETKVEDHAFPQAVFLDLGYTLTLYGQKTYNGVAIFTKGAVSDIQRGLPAPDFPAPYANHCRVLGVTYQGVRLYSVYAPNGKAPDDPAFQYKEHWYQRFGQYLQQRYTAQDAVLLGGDFNIAPQPQDVADPVAMARGCGFHPAERAWLEAFQARLGWVDSYRVHQPQGQAYSWWDYRENSLRRDRGMRIDQLWLTPALATRTTASGIDKAPRTWDKPSDHTVIWVRVGV